jgi:hypothetical protein
MANGNGNSRLVYWVIGLIFPVLTGACASLLHTLQSNTERIAIQESRVQEIRQQLRRIEDKLDHVLEHRADKPPQR